MKLVIPINILDSDLSQINIPEDDASEWSAGTNYSSGDTSMIILAEQTNSAPGNYLQYYRANLISGNAFLEINDTDISAFIGTDYGETSFAVELTDTSGYTALGYIAGGGKGRALGVNLVKEGGFSVKANVEAYWSGWDDGWTWYGYGAVGNNAWGLYQSGVITPQQLYFAKYLAYGYTSGTFGMYYGDYTNQLWSRTGNGNFEEYGFTNAGSDVGIQLNGSGYVAIDDIDVRAVTEPVTAISGGCHIVSEVNGTFRSWAYINPNFNGRQIVRYRIYACGSTKYHKVYESLKDDNVGKFPPATCSGDSPWWLELGSTNKWRLFDSAVGSQCTYPNTISMAITPTEEFDSVALFNLDGDTIELSIEDGNDLTTNGSFDTISDWTRENGWTIIPS